MVKMIVTDSYHGRFVGGFGDAFSELNYRLELLRVRRQTETVRRERNTRVQQYLNVRCFHQSTHGPYAEAFCCKRRHLNSFKHCVFFSSLFLAAASPTLACLRQQRLTQSWKVKM